ncbi:MAG: hypothetical protein AAF288_06755 [Planctomycetota bacterium]
MNFLKNNDDAGIDPQVDGANPSGSTDSDNGTTEALSMMGGGFGGDVRKEGDPLGLEGPATPKIPQTALVVGGLLIVGAGVLLGMRLTQSPMAADASTQEVVAQVDAFVQKMADPTSVDPNDPFHKDNLDNLVDTADEIAARLNSDHSDKLVPVHEVHKNPFRFGFTKAKAPVDDSAAEAKRLAEEAARQDRALRTEAERLKLESLMGGPRPMAVINGEFYRPGDSISENFTLASIDSTGVAIEAGELTLRLSIRQDTDGSRR